MSIIPELLLKQWQLLSWKDGLEILFFVLIFYQFSRWLKTDTYKNLLLPFYGYCTLAISAYALNLATLHTFLLLYAPVALIVLIISHQQMLQRNFVTYKNITPTIHDAANDWQSVLIRCCLHMINKKKPLLCIIEQNDSLKDYFKTAANVRTPVDHTILTMLLDSPTFEHDKVMWISATGIINAINCTWQDQTEYVLFQADTSNLAAWKQDAVLFTAKTDAIVLYCCPETRSFSILAQGKLIEQASAASSLRIIKQYTKSTQKPTKGPINEASSAASTLQQQKS